MSISRNIQRAWRGRARLSAMLRYGAAGFSQFGEDRVFDCLLKPAPGGTYVDVGAHHPVLGSNTFLLYAKGWSGLTVDPNPKFAPLFRKERPHDVHLAEGASRVSATRTYHQFALDWNNTFDASVAERLRADGLDYLGARDVPCRPLADMIEEHLKDRPIDLLNVDCEGLDLEVLESLDIARHRPATIIVEDFQSFWTFQRGERPAPVEVFLRDNRYQPIAQTAWSRIYVAKDWRDLFGRSQALDAREAESGGYLPAQ